MGAGSSGERRYAAIEKTGKTLRSAIKGLCVTPSGLFDCLFGLSFLLISSFPLYLQFCIVMMPSLSSLLAFGSLGANMFS